MDPPYTVAHNNNGFIKYNQNLFSWADQVRLRDAIQRAVKRGVKVIVTNANHQSIRDIYSAPEFELKVLSRLSTISGKSKSRGKFEEIVILANI